MRVAIPLLAILALLALWGARRYRHYREEQDLRIGHEKLHAWVIVPQKRSHSKEHP